MTRGVGAFRIVHRIVYKEFEREESSFKLLSSFREATPAPQSPSLNTLSFQPFPKPLLRFETCRLGLLRDGRRATLGEGLASAFTLFANTKGKELVVFRSLRLGLGLLGFLRRRARVLALDDERGDETLNLRRLGLLLAGGGFELTTVRVHVLANIIFLGQGEELTNLARTLRTAETRNFGIRQARNLGVALLDDDQVQHRNVLGDDATTARLASAFTLTATERSETAGTLGHEQEDALVRQHALLHAEPLLVVTTHDLEDVAFPFLRCEVKRERFRSVRDTNNTFSRNLPLSPTPPPSIARGSSSHARAHTKP